MARAVSGLLVLLLLTAGAGSVRAADAEPAPAPAVSSAPVPAARPAAPAARDSVVVKAAALADTGSTRRAGPVRPWYRQPRWIMLRSVAVPGWGQWANGRHVKAAVVAVGEGYLLYRAVDYGRQEQAKAKEIRAATDPVELELLVARHGALGSHRRDFTWWSIFAAMLSMGDAYVDAQLGNFDVQFEPQDTGETSGAVPGAKMDWRVAVNLRW